jgi:hypothetical protein
MKPNQRKPSTRDTNKSNTSVLMSFFLIGLDVFFIYTSPGGLIGITTHTVTEKIISMIAARGNTSGVKTSARGQMVLIF